jgi:hypothetical protein
MECGREGLIVLSNLDLPIWEAFYNVKLLLISEDGIMWGAKKESSCNVL